MFCLTCRERTKIGLWARNVLSFDGRAGRAEFWLYSAKVLLLQMLLVGAVSYARSGSFVPDEAALPSDAVLLAVLFIARLGAFRPLAAVWARRSHDLGWSARWVVVWLACDLALWCGFVAVTATGAGVRADAGPSLSALAVFDNVVDFVLVLALGLMHGRVGPNRYGPDPKGDGEPAYRSIVLGGSEPA